MSRFVSKFNSNFKLQSILRQTSPPRGCPPKMTAAKMSTESMVNILIVFNDTDVKDSGLSSAHLKTLFQRMKTSITAMIGRNKYTIYDINSGDMKANDSWHLNTALVITIGDQTDHKSAIKADNQSFSGDFVNFRLKDLLINFKPNNENPIEFNCDYFEQQMSGYLKSDLNNRLNQMDLNDTTDPTKTYLITKETNETFIDNNRHLFKKIRFIDENNDTNETQERAIDGSLDLTINANFDNISFDTKSYFANLKTERLGQWLAFAERTETTMRLIESFAGIDGFVAITNEQTRGRGRHQNEWLSPKGCAMFTIQLSIDLNSNIGRKMAFIQHLTALSIVEGVKSIPGYEALDLVLKWPNDILWRKTKGKISGILVTSTYTKRSLNVLIGCGINVSNREPSLCLNRLIDDHNSLTNKKLDYLHCEQVIATTLTQMERLLHICEQTDGMKVIEDMYTKQWLHSDEVIKLVDNDRELMVRVDGLDNDGYLLVKDLSTGCPLSLHPDGNRFDIMRNLLITRRQN